MQQTSTAIISDPNIGRGREKERKGERERERERKGERRRGKEGRRRLVVGGVSTLHTPRK